MKKNKFFGLIGTTGAMLTLGTISAVATSCSYRRTFIEAADIDVSIIGNNMAAYLQYTLNRALTKDQKLVVAHDDGGQFVFGDYTIKNKLVTVPVYWLKQNVHDTISWTGDMTFTCINTKTSKVVWSQVITGSKVTYYPYCILQKNIDVTTTTISADGKTITAEMEFEVPTGLPEEYYPKLKAHFSTGDYDNQFIIDEAKVKITFDEETNKGKISIPATTKNTGVADGNSFKFDIQIFCMYSDTDIPIWISNNYTGIRVSYFVAENPIPYGLDDGYIQYELDPLYGDYGYYQIVGINPKAFNEGYNTLFIPDFVTRIGDGNATVHNPINLPESVTKISFAPNSVLTIIEEKAFYGNKNISFIDLTSINDTADKLSLLKFGANSFGDWSESGQIIWSSDMSQYNRHILILDLYNGGLTQPDWYNFKEVKTEGQLREAVDTGVNVRLGASITLGDGEYERDDYTGQVDIEKSLLIDLNGKTITSKKPIYNYDEKEFAIFGIWSGADVIVTDLSKNHDGAVVAYNQHHDGSSTRDLGRQVTPTDPNDYDKDLWDLVDNEDGTYAFKPRECRCFYIRTDTPSKHHTSLEIMTGNYYGNCTTVMNWNGICWIEDMFTAQEAAEGEPYKYAPQFHVFTPYSEYKSGDKGAVDHPYAEIINCDNGNSALGTAMFEVYSAKFYAVQCLDKTKVPTTEWKCYKPSDAENDPVIDPGTGTEVHANWLANGYQEIENGTGENKYILTRPKA